MNLIIATLFSLNENTINLHSKIKHSKHFYSHLIFKANKKKTNKNYWLKIYLLI